MQELRVGGRGAVLPGGGAPELVRSKRTLMSIETIYEESRHSKWNQDKTSSFIFTD